MSHNTRLPGPVRNVLAALLLALGIAGCGVRIDGPPPPLPSPDGDESARQRAAVFVERVAARAAGLGAAGGPEDDVERVASEAEAHLDALGGVWRPPPWATASPTTSLGAPGSEAEELGSRDESTTPSFTGEDLGDLLASAAAETCAGALDVEAGELTTLLASICLAQRGSARALGAELEELPRPADDLARADLLANGLVGSSDVPGLVRALDAAGFALEVAAARASAPHRDDLAARARSHRETAHLLVTAAGTLGTAEDPRRAAYALSEQPREPADVESDVLAAWAAVLGTADQAARGAVVSEMEAAARAAHAWGAPRDAFPGLAED